MTPADSAHSHLAQYHRDPALHIKLQINVPYKPKLLKETVSRDFRPLVFFHISTAPRPLINTLKYFRILFRIRGAIRL
jgi:hypothetical protein